jgi:uncharacterized repeat protein (TIGR01451 family)
LTSTTGRPTWAGIIIDGGQAELAHTTVEYACSDVRKSNLAILNGGQLDLADSRVRECHFGGGAGERSLRIEEGQAFIQNTSFQNTDQVHVYVTGDSAVRIAGSSIEGADQHGLLVEGDQAWIKVTGSTLLSNGAFGGEGVRNTGKATVILGGDPGEGNFIAYNHDYGANQSGLAGQIIATYNYWGDPSGPTHPGNPGGRGEPVSDRVLYEPWLTEPPGGTLPPTSLVQTYGPKYISPGDAINLGVVYRNTLTETWSNAVVVAELPDEVEYLSSSAGGQYWPVKHQVLWKPGHVPPGAGGLLAIQVRYHWGLRAHQITHFSALLAAENLANQWVDLEEVLAAYDSAAGMDRTELTDQEFHNLLAGDDELNALYQQVQNDGFTYYGGAFLETSRSGQATLKLAMLNLGRREVVAYLYRDGGGAWVMKDSRTELTVYNLQGGYRYHFETKEIETWGQLTGSLAAAFGGSCSLEAGCGYWGKSDCLRNCLALTYDSSSNFGGFSPACGACYSGRTGSCAKCAAEMARSDDSAAAEAARGCQNSCGNDPAQWETWQCVGNNRFGECVRMPDGMIMGRFWACKDCQWWIDSQDWDFCHPGESCRKGHCEPECEVNCDRDRIEALIAGDPNAMYGPGGVLPGQVITYTIEYENVGEGSAHGVYVESRLPAGLEENTLLVQEGGLYFDSSRMLLWEVGTLGPGEGGTVHFQVRVPLAAPSGTVFIASAVVYFPSVPEVTPTNDVVTMVGEVIGYPQGIETAEGVAVAITLAGDSPGGTPLQFTVTRPPGGGELSGSAPNLIYTPAENFEGADWFEFIVSDGEKKSLPAVVTILVNTGVETNPPQILSTSPQDGARDVRVYKDPLFGNVYAPTILAYTSEPMDSSSLTAGTVSLVDDTGHALGIEVSYNSYLKAIQLVLHEPLGMGRTYMVTLSTGVKDTSGNPLAAAYKWSFTAQSRRIYLPALLWKQ